MRVTELEPAGGEIVRIIRRQRAKEAARTGLHVSTIVQDILACTNPAKFGSARKPLPEGVAFAYQEFGNVLEDVLARQLARRLGLWTKPEPRVYRGIWGSPDGWDPRTRTIDEIKATWVSETDFVTTDETGLVIDESEKFMAYRLQFSFYDLAWDARRVRLHVLFINGKYPRGGGPIPSTRTFTIRQSDAEKERNFRQLAIHARDRKLDGYKGVTNAER